MNIIVLNRKLRKKSGDIQALEYIDATYEIRDGMLRITHGKPSDRRTSIIQMDDVAEIQEKLPVVQ